MNVRIRFGAGKRAWFQVPNEARAQALRDLAGLLARAEKHAEASIILAKAARCTDAELREVQRFAEQLCSGKIPKKPVVNVMTVRQLGRAWTSGELHTSHPDQVKKKRSVRCDVSRLEKYVYPKIGDKPVRDLTLEDCESVMASIPEARSPLTRRNVGQTLARMLKIAKYPLKIIAQSPIPEGFLPRARSTKAMAYLYPDEDRVLLACKDVPLAYRILWGFLAREGMRVSEALNLTVGDLDLERGAIRLDKNKTDDPRSWALSPGAVAALRRYVEGRGPEALVFPGPPLPVKPGEEPPPPVPMCPTTLPKFLRKHLKRAGVNRAELFVTNEQRQKIRVHDLRGTFVTLALANGKTETWVCDRTGHKSSQMVNKYRRAARTAGELNLGELTPLDVALGWAKPAQGGSIVQLEVDQPAENSCGTMLAEAPVCIRKPQVPSSILGAGSRNHAGFLIALCRLHKILHKIAQGQEAGNGTGNHWSRPLNTSSTTFLRRVSSTLG